MTQVSIDEDFARFGSKSYAINKINSIEVRERQPHGLGGAIFCGLLSLAFLLAALTSIGSEEGFSFGSFVIAAIFAAIAYGAWVKSKIREYTLFLMTSSSEAQAFTTRDVQEISDLRERIETAMLRHSRGAIHA